MASGDYKYVYTFRNPVTLHQGNPCIEMQGTITNDFATTSVSLSLWGLFPALPNNDDTVSHQSYFDEQCFGQSSLMVYRSGGDFADSLYRFVGSANITVGYCTVEQGATQATVTLLAGSSFDTSWNNAGKTIKIGYQTFTIDTVAADGQSLLVTENPESIVESTSWVTDTIFIDSNTDADIASAMTAEWDNDAPVTADLPSALQMNIVEIKSGSGSAGMNRFEVEVIDGMPVNQDTGLRETDIRHVLLPGTIIQIGVGSGSEYAVIQALPIDPTTSANEIVCYFQLAHTINTQVEAVAVCNQPCELVAQAFNSMFLAGDKWNPATLYRSKTGDPESFPVTEYIEVGSPSNYINGITDWNGEILCLNRSAFYLVTVWGGTMQTPVRTPAQRGLIGRRAWCKADNEIWYLAHDGVYSWSGGVSTKRSEPIDPIFRGETVILDSTTEFIPLDLSEVQPWTGRVVVDGTAVTYFSGALFDTTWAAGTEIDIAGGTYTIASVADTSHLTTNETVGQYDLTNPAAYMVSQGSWQAIAPVDRIQFAYYRNQIFITYQDTDGNLQRITYHTLYDRWYVLDTDPSITCMLTEEDTGKLITARTVDRGAGYEASLYEEDTSADAAGFTTDEWYGDTDVDRSNGSAIDYEIWTGFQHAGLPTIQKVVGDVILELENPDDGTGAAVRVRTYYDHSLTADPTDDFTITPTTGRRRYTMTIQGGRGKECYSVSFRISGSTKKPIKFYSLTFHWFPLEEIQRGRATDWDDLGHPYDKRLFEFHLEYDTNGQDVEIALDTINGIGGATVNLDVQHFTLSSSTATYPPTAGATGPVRAKHTFPVEDGIIAKLVRLRVVTTTTTSTSSTTTTTSETASTASTTSTSTTTSTTTTTEEGVDFAPHNMTARDVPSPYYVTWRSSYLGFCDGWKVFDGAFGWTDQCYEWWGTNWADEYLRLDLGAGNSKVLLRYAFKMGPTHYWGTTPRNWTMRGSNDNVVWDIVDTVTGNASMYANETRYFECDVHTVAYRYFKLQITANQDGQNQTRIGEMYLYEPTSTTSTTTTTTTTT